MLVKRAFTAAGEPRASRRSAATSRVVTSGIIELAANPAATPGTRARAKRGATSEGAARSGLSRAGAISRYLTRQATSGPLPGRDHPAIHRCAFGGR